jgi:SAM-dependent methyltransferase
MSLWSEFLTNEQRLVHKWKHYFPAYEQHFQRFVNRDVVFLEIGCFHGGSLSLWKRYFGPHATIVGIDISPECASFAEDQIFIRIGDQADPAFLESVCAEFGLPDIVLDDGSHVMSHVNTSFEYLYPRMRPNSVYMVEDMHAAYWPEYEGGLGVTGSFIEKCKGLIDQLHADHIPEGLLPPNEFTRTTLSIHFYDSIVAFEKGRHTAKSAPAYGNPVG